MYPFSFSVVEKKIAPFFYLLLLCGGFILLSFIGTPPKGQPLTEGKIVYEKTAVTDSSGSIQPPSADTLFPFRFTQYFRGHRFRLEIEYDNGKSEVLIGDSSGRIWLVETPTAKWAVLQNPKTATSFNWRDGKETEKIESYKCKQVFADLTHPKMSLMCYRTDEVLSPHWYFTAFKNGLLAFELPAGNRKIGYHAKEVQDYRVAETQLRVPPKYERISEADFYHWLSE